MFLTKRQSELLDYLRKSIALQGYAPSLEELAAHFHLSSVGTVHKHLRALEEKGVIRRQWNRSRSIEIVGLPDGKARRLPLLGRLSAGRPIAKLEGQESRAVPEDMLGRSEAFVLEIEGDGFASERLQAGDVVVIDQRDRVREDEVALLMIDEGAHIGSYSNDGRQVELRSSDARRPALRVDSARCQLRGVVVGVLRHMRGAAASGP